MSTFAVETHMSMTVPDIDAAIEFLKAIEPELEVRHDATPKGIYRWANIGKGDSYIALQEPHLTSLNNSTSDIRMSKRLEMGGTSAELS